MFTNKEDEDSQLQENCTNGCKESVAGEFETNLQCWNSEESEKYERVEGNT